MTDTPTEAPKRPRGRPKGGVGTANREIDYRCNTCKKEQPRDNLIVKKVTYVEIGRGGKNIKSVTMYWVCRECAAQEPEWSRRPFVDAPGMRGTTRRDAED